MAARLVDRVERGRPTVRIGLVGKYVNLPDAYLSVAEALQHGGYACGAQVEIDWIASDDAEGLLAEGRLRDLDGIVIPGGFGFRGIEGKIAAAGFAREQRDPVPRPVPRPAVRGHRVRRATRAGSPAPTRASSTRTRPHPVIDLMDEQRDVVDMGGTMRLGAYPAKLLPGTIVQQAYGEEVVYERHRHRYEVNNHYRAPPRGGRARVLGHLARRPAGRVRRAAATCTRSSSAPRRTPSSRAGPTARTRCSRRSCRRRATGPRAARPRLPLADRAGDPLGDR